MVNIRTLITLALLGAGFGVAGPSAAQEKQAIALATSPKAYYVAEFELKDPEGIKPYSANVTATFAPFGGKYIVRGGKVIALEGEGPGSRTVVIEFPSLERAQAWYDSAAYRDLRPIRQKSGISRTYIIEGLPN